MIPPGQGYSADLTNVLMDAGKRASDILNEIITGNRWEDIRTKFVAIRLSDGGWDGVLYDNKRDAVRHQLHEQQCAYVGLINLPGGTRPREMAVFLKMHRDAYYRGMRLVDPDAQNGGPDIAITAARGDVERQRFQNLFMRSNGGSRA